MADKTKIEWTNASWNPMRGCRPVSEGCRLCYAQTQAHRHSGPGGSYEGLTKMTSRGARWTGDVRWLPELLDQPLRWRKPRRIFVNSMSDVFFEAFTFEQIAALFAVMAAADRHTFQILTKRPARALEFFTWLEMKAQSSLSKDIRENLVLDGDRASWRNRILCDAARAHGVTRPLDQTLGWPLPNVWLGVSVEDQATADERIPILAELPAAVRWISAEPLLGPVDLSAHADALGWVVVGGESDPYKRARPMEPEWVRKILEDCDAAGVPVFVKQMGLVLARRWGLTKTTAKGTKPDYKGGNPEQWPEWMRRRAYPNTRGEG